MKKRWVWLMVLVLLSIEQMEAEIMPVDQPSYYGMFDLYEANRKEGIPNYITEDFVLLAYSLAINEAVTHLEEQNLVPAFQAYVETLGKLSGKDRASKRNRDFLGVISSLLSGGKIPKWVSNSKTVKSELDKVLDAKGIARSDLVRQTLDYTQFQVRGKYTRSEILVRYFRAMRYANTVLFPVVATKATDISVQDADVLTEQALALSALMKNEDVANKRRDLESKLMALFGPSRDLEPEDYLAQKKQKTQALRDNLLQMAREEGKQPLILSGIVKVKDLEEGLSAADALTGFRLIPQVFTPDAAAFQYLVYHEVGEYLGMGQPQTAGMIDGKLVKVFPSNLELMALLGSAEAEMKLDETDERNYTGYGLSWRKARDVLHISGGLVSDQLSIIQYWLTQGHADIPDAARRLKSCQALWTYQRYSSQLYVKQSYTADAKSFSMNPPREKAWISPASTLYLVLALRVHQIQEALGESKQLNTLSELLYRCAEIALQTSQGRRPSSDNSVFLNELDKAFLEVTGRKDMPIVVDIHTDPNSNQVLEEAIGYPKSVYHNIGETQARGALFTHYEFKHPQSDRLTDAAWQMMLKE